MAWNLNSSDDRRPDLLTTDIRGVDDLGESGFITARRVVLAEVCSRLDYGSSRFNVAPNLWDWVSLGLDPPIMGEHQQTMAHPEGFEPPTPSSEDWLYGALPLFAGGRSNSSLACLYRVLTGRSVASGRERAQTTCFVVGLLSEPSDLVSARMPAKDWLCLCLASCRSRLRAHGPRSGGRLQFAEPHAIIMLARRATCQTYSSETSQSVWLRRSSTELRDAVDHSSRKCWRFLSRRRSSPPR
jgi:hypothetical protein